MRGLVSTEFLDFFETSAGADMVEIMLEACNPASGGAYTSVGTYDHHEILDMLKFLHEATGQAVSDMVTAFGQQLFGELIAQHPGMLRDGVGLLDFLEGIETHIHQEVRKLYRDAELPFFAAERLAANKLVLNYQSSRPFADLAHGMILGAAAHFNGQIELSRKTITIANGHAESFTVSVVK
jgi:hypothetical protein